MKRDPELIRELLLLIEANGVEPLKCREVRLDGYEYADIMSQLNLLYDAGFLVAERSLSKTNPGRVIAVELIFDLSWKGHEYLDTIRDPEVWRKTKELTKKAGSSSFEFVMEVAQGVARDALRSYGLPI